MPYSWAKLWIDVLDDHKLGPLPDHLWRRFFELVLVAKEADDGGWLPSVRAMAWRLRCDEGELEQDLQGLAEVNDGDGPGLVEYIEGAWYVTNFASRQDKPMEPVERKRRERRRAYRANPTGAPVTVQPEPVTGPVTTRDADCHEDVTTRDIDKTRQEEETRQDEKAGPPVPRPVQKRRPQKKEATPAAPEEGATGPPDKLSTVTMQEIHEPAAELVRLWPSFQKGMQAQLQKGSYATWIAGLSPVKVDGDRVIVATVSDYVSEWCSSRLKTPIERTMSELMGRVVQVSYVVAEA